MKGKSSRKEMDEEGTSYFLKLGSYDALKLKRIFRFVAVQLCAVQYRSYSPLVTTAYLKCG